MAKQPILVHCRWCDEEWGPADLNRAGLCPGCVEDLSKAEEKGLDMDSYQACRRAERERELRAVADHQQVLLGRVLELPYAAVAP